MANIISIISDDNNKSVVVNNRKRKNKELSKEDEEMKRMIFQSDNPFKIASELEERFIVKNEIKSVTEMKKLHRRMRSLYKNASSLIDEQRKQRFGIKPRLRAIRRTQQRQEGNNINMLMDNIQDMEYRLPTKIHTAKEVDDLVGLMDRQLWISPMMEQQSPLLLRNNASAGEGQNTRQLEGGFRRSVVFVNNDDDERPASKRQRRSFILNVAMLQQ